MTRQRRFGFPATVLAAVLLLTAAAWAEAPRNVILMIGDGMGFEHVRAASYYAAGGSGQLAFEEHYRGEVTTHSRNSHTTKNHATDSAAAATAFATGHKTNNGLLSRTPDGDDLPTLLERFRAAGKWTGLVTTVPMTHATPAAFGAHADKRSQYAKIADHYFTETRPNILFGAYWKNKTGVTAKKATDAAYTVVRTRDEMDEFVATANAAEEPAAFHVSGQFSPEQFPWEYTEEVKTKHKLSHTGPSDVTFETAPHLSEMAAAAVTLLARGPKGFFLLIEGGAIDWASHDNVIERAVFETLEFDKAFQAVMKWAEDRDDTLVLVTADHECGGLAVVKSRGKGKFPDVFWARRDHSGANVPLYAWGPGAERFEGVVDNTALLPVLTGAAERQAEPAAVN